MKRLTKRLSNGEAILDCDNCELQQSYECGEILCRDRLRNRVAAYEDTALEPEEVATIKLALMGKSIAAVEVFNGTPISRLIELAEADKAGRVIILPCKVGDTAYYLNGPFIIDFEVIGYMVDECGAWSFMGEHLDKTTGDTYSCCPDTDKVGKTVFLTREEAEKALQQMEGENGIENSKSYPEKDEPDGTLRQ